MKATLRAGWNESLEEVSIINFGKSYTKIIKTHTHVYIHNAVVHTG